MRAFMIIRAMMLGGIALTLSGAAQAEAPKVEVITDGLDHPWAVAQLPNGGYLITERSGDLIAYHDGRKTRVSGLPEVAARGQGGLLDLVLDDSFATTRQIYFTWSRPGPGGASTALSRATLSLDGASLRDVEILFDDMRKTSSSHHYGSRIVLGAGDTLFVTTGDRGDGPRAQDPDDFAGKVLRLNRDGSIPADNPVPGSPVWSLGHRNPQGAAMDNSTGTLWTVEHGARGGDELNTPAAGKNYGWPEISYGTNYNGSKIGIGTQATGMEQPRFYWDPSIAPSGLAIYSGDMFPEWQGDILVGALKYQMLVRLERDGPNITTEHRYPMREYGRIRDVRVAKDGSILLLTDENNGALLRLTPQ